MRKPLVLLLLLSLALLVLGCETGSNFLSRSMQQGQRQSQLEKNLKMVKRLREYQGSEPDYRPLKEGKNYTDGYKNGYDSGYRQGNKDGTDVQPYAPTLKSVVSGKPAYDDGYANGYENGYDAGFRDGTLSAAGTEPSTAAEQQETGANSDRDAGHEAGFKAGYQQGKNDWVLGYGYYNFTPEDAVVKQNTNGRSSAYVEGWKEGYKDGYVQAWEEQANG